MAKHGQMDEFSGEGDDWTTYGECLEPYFVANDITSPDKKCAMLLSCCGSAMHKIIRSIIYLKKETDFTFEELEKVVKNHYAPKPSKVVQRYKFNSHSQQAGESIADFMDDLRRLSVCCDFNADTLSDMPCHCLVCGIGNTKTQQRLVAEADN